MVPNRPHHIPWDGMVAIVTGSSRGIGAAVARSLGGQGVNVVVNYLTQAETAEAVVADIRARGGKAVAAQADVSTTEGAQSLFEAAEKHFGKIDVIVNNASPSIVRKPFSELKFADLENYWNGYVRGAFELIQLAIPGMRRREFGRIVNILTSSLIGAPPPELTAYVTAKSALMGLSKAAAVELGRWGITVNMVSPSIVLTDQWNGISESQLRALGLRVPLGRLAQAEEVASVVVFLLSEQGQYLNGVNIPITGGREM